MGGTPIAGWFIREKPIKMDENWGYPYARKPPSIEDIRKVDFERCGQGLFSEFVKPGDGRKWSSSPITEVFLQAGPVYVGPMVSHVWATGTWHDNIWVINPWIGHGHLEWLLGIKRTYMTKSTRATMSIITELDDGWICRKPLYLMVKTMVSCRFSHRNNSMSFSRL